MQLDTAWLVHIYVHVSHTICSLTWWLQVPCRQRRSSLAGGNVPGSRRVRHPQNGRFWGTDTQKAGPGRLLSNAEAEPERPPDMGPMRHQHAPATRALKRQQALPHLVVPMGTAKMGAIISSRCCCVSASAVMEGSPCEWAAAMGTRVDEGYDTAR
jgi:hypothetical protein